MSVLLPRRQNTIARPVQVSGYGLFGGIDVTVEFCPADPDHGIVFERIDLSESPRIPARIESVVPQPRCTVIADVGVQVAVIEHVMAALAGLQVDNCLIRIDAPEPPACDGSSEAFVEAILKAGVVAQDQPREALLVEEAEVITESDQVGIAVQPSQYQEYEIGFFVDYGAGPIPRQSSRVVTTPERFCREIAPARTFVLESEVRALQEQGIGHRATPENVLVFGDQGPIRNALRFADECARHKILDCIGDFALLGCDLMGRFLGTQSGHRLNHALIRRLKTRYLNEAEQTCGPDDEQPSSPSTRRSRVAG